MTEVEKNFFDDYKQLDAVCRDMFSCQNGIGEYIVQMEQNSFMQHRVPLWNEDYRKLKRWRWLRNQIAHTTSSTECGQEDIEQLRSFHNRILNRQDSLAVLGQIQRTARQTPQQRQEEVLQIPQHRQRTVQRNPIPSYSDYKKIPPRKSYGYLLDMGIIILFVIIVFVIICLLK